MKLLNTFLILISLCGCGEAVKRQPISAAIGSEKLFPFVKRVEASHSIIGDDTGVLNTAIDAWNDAVGRPLITRDPGGFPIQVSWVDRIDVENISPEAAAYARRFKEYCDISIKKIDNSQRYFYDEITILIHELGHCIGFMHSENKESIMHEYVYPDSWITTEAVRMINLEGAE